MREPDRIPDLSDVAPYERFYGRYLYPASSFHMGDVLDHSCITALAPNCLSALRLFSINQVSLVLLSPAYYSDSYGLIACSLVILARGCRAKNPDFFCPPGRRLRDSSRTLDTRE